MPSRSASKARILQEQGVLNRHSENVAAPLFSSHDFFDPRDLLQVKYEMLRCVQLDGLPAAVAAAAHGLSRPSYYKAEVDFEREGLSGLLPRQTGPKAAHKFTPEVLEFIHDILGESPRLAWPEVALRVHARFGRQVHPRSIERILSQQQKKRLQDSQEPG